MLPSRPRFTVFNFRLIASFLDHPDDIYSLASTCRDACEGCDSDLVWSILTFSVFQEIVEIEKSVLPLHVNKHKLHQVEQLWNRRADEAIAAIEGQLNIDISASGSARANRRHRAKYRNNSNNNNNNNTNNNNHINNSNPTSAAQQEHEALFSSAVLIAHEQDDSMVTFTIVSSLLPWRSTAKLADCIDDESKANEARARVQSYLPSVLFSCRSFQEFRLRCLLSSELCQFYDPSELDLKSRALANLRGFENKTLGYLWFQPAQNSKLFATGGVMNELSREEGSHGECIQRFIARKYAELVNVHADENHLSIFETLRDKIWQSRTMNNWRAKIYDDVDEIRAAQDVLMCEERHVLNFLNWKTQAAFCGGHSLLKYLQFWTVPVSWLAPLSKILDIVMIIPVGFLHALIGSEVVKDSLGAGGEQQQQRRQGGFFSFLTENLLTRTIRREISASFGFPTSVFSERSTMNSSNSSLLIPSPLTPSPFTFYLLLAFAATSSVLATGLNGKFPRLQGVAPLYRAEYFKHKILLDLFAAWGSRLNDFWVFYFVKLAQSLSGAILLPAVSSIGNFLIESATTVLSRERITAPFSSVVISPNWFDSITDLPTKFAAACCSNLVCALDIKTACVLCSVAYTVWNVRHTHKTEYGEYFCSSPLASKRKHKPSKWNHVASDAVFNVSLCLLRWNLYFSETLLTADNFEGASSDTFTKSLWHFGKIVGLEFLLRSSSSLVEYFTSC